MRVRVRRSTLVLLLVGLAGGGWWFFTRGALSVVRVGPKPTAGSKVVVLLHGYGAAGDDLVPLAEELSRAAPAVTFLMPEGPAMAGVTGRAWVPNFVAPSREAYVERLRVEVDQTRAKLWKVLAGVRGKGVRCEDVTVGGFSQGGRIAAELALRAPADCPLGGVIVLSGGGVTELPLPEGEGLPPMRVFVSHGTRDPIVPSSEGLATAKHFAAGGHAVTQLLFDGAHQISPEVRRALAEFLAAEAQAP